MNAALVDKKQMGNRSHHALASFWFARYSLLGALVLASCSGANGKAPAGADLDSTGASGRGGAGSAGAGAATPSRSGSAGNGLNLELDAGPFDQHDAGGCSRLNIGVLGNPGSNGSSDFQQWLMKSGTSVTRIQTTAAEAMTKATLEPFDVVVLDCLTRDYTADEAGTFATWVATGGGVAAMSGFHDDPIVDWHANSLLAPLGIVYKGDRVWGPATSFANHPSTAGLTSVTFTGGYSVADLGGSASTRTPVAFLPGSNVVVGLAAQMAAGRAFVWGDEWIEFDSEWSSNPEISRLWVQIFAFIGPTTKCSLVPPK